MQISRCSTSAIKSYKTCAFKYYLDYILDIDTPSGKSAVMGNIVHKVFEWMCKLKLKDKTNIDPKWLLSRAFDEFSHADLRKVTSKGISADYKRLEKSIEIILADRMYNPYNLNIISAEKRFELDMPGPEWAVELDGIIKQFSVRGVIDLVHEIDKDTIEIVDWKNGKKIDFATFKPLDFYDLCKEIQPRIYHLAVSQLFPEYKNILITFYYINEDGSTTMGFSDNEIPYTIDTIYNFFQTVKKDSVIRRNRTWRCRMCPYNKEDNCTKIWSELNTMGEKFVKDRYHQINISELNKNV